METATLVTPAIREMLCCYRSLHCTGIVLIYEIAHVSIVINTILRGGGGGGGAPLIHNTQ